MTRSFRRRNLLRMASCEERGKDDNRETGTGYDGDVQVSVPLPPQKCNQSYCCCHCRAQNYCRPVLGGLDHHLSGSVELFHGIRPRIWRVWDLASQKGAYVIPPKASLEIQDQQALWWHHSSHGCVTEPSY